MSLTINAFIYNQ